MARVEEAYLQFRQGDLGAFDQVMEELREPLIFFLLRYLPSVDDAEDAAEDAFVELLLHPWKESKGAGLKTYLFTLGRSRALNLLKKQKRRGDFHGELPEDAPADVEALEDRLCRDETRRQLLRALEKISPDYREAVYFLYFEELSLNDAARIMRKSKKQVENLSYRGRQALKKILEKEGEL